MTDSITVRFFAGARAAAGTPTADATAGTLAELLDALGERHGEPLRRVLPSCSFLIDGTACHDQRVKLPAGATVDVLPPFAGG